MLLCICRILFFTLFSFLTVHSHTIENEKSCSPDVITSELDQQQRDINNDIKISAATIIPASSVPPQSRTKTLSRIVQNIKKNLTLESFLSKYYQVFKTVHVKHLFVCFVKLNRGWFQNFTCKLTI